LEVFRWTGASFCNIVKGLQLASLVYADERVLAFLDVQPVNSGHMLIIPKIHAAQPSELQEEIGGHMFRVALRLAAALKRSRIRCEGINFHLADGEAASQDVFNVHLHVIPRSKGDGFGMKFGPHYGLRPKREELDRMTLKIKLALS
jgi:histidine triad (HIT) family protein